MSKFISKRKQRVNSLIGKQVKNQDKEKTLAKKKAIAAKKLAGKGERPQGLDKQPFVDDLKKAAGKK